MAQTSISNTSVTYKSDGATIDVVAQTEIDLNKTLADSNSVADFHSASIPLRWRAFAEYFADLTEAQRKVEIGDWVGGPNLDAGTLSFIDYVNAQLYNVVRSAGLTIASSAAVCTSIPRTPTVVAVAVGNTQLTATWTDVAPASTGYKVFYRLCPLGTENLAFVVAGTEWVGAKAAAGTVITGLSNGSQYGVVVAGTNAQTISGYNYSTVKYQTPSA
jgi:hypothetical protein